MALNQQGSATSTIVNDGMISGAGRTGARLGSNASVTNTATGTITGLTGIVFRDPTNTNTPVVNGSVFHRRHDHGTGGTADEIRGDARLRPVHTDVRARLCHERATSSAPVPTSSSLAAEGTGSFRRLSTVGASSSSRGFTDIQRKSGFWNTVGTFGLDANLECQGGALAGTGTFAGINVNNGGTLSPGTSGVGTLTVNGSLCAGLGLALSRHCQFNHINPGGCERDHHDQQRQHCQGSVPGYELQNQYTILTTNGRRTGTFGSLTTKNLPSFSATGRHIVYLPTEVDSKIGTSLGQISGLTANQSAVAAGFDEA